MSTHLRLAVVTGGHPHDVANFHALFTNLAGIAATIQHLDDWASSSPDYRKSFDTVLFYVFFQAGPTDQNPWYQGSVKTALSELTTTAQGVVILHHATLAYPQWEFWSDLVGISARNFKHHLGQRARYVIADHDHPITRNLTDWDMDDETYTMAEPAAGSHVLVTTAHQPSMRAIVWTRTIGAARVLNIQSGHDAASWTNATFIELLRRGVRWTAATDLELPAAMTGVIFPEKGRATLRREPSPTLKPGHILCRSLVTGVTNGTERNVMMGGNYGGTWPSRCAYQNVGQVLAIGAGVTGFALGDRVFNADFTGHVQFFSAHADGLTITLPTTITNPEAALLGMASVALHDVRRARVALGERVLIVGAGPVGQFAAQAARAAGAVVTVADLDDRRLDLATKLGAHAIFNTTGGWTGITTDGAFDCVIDASGAPIIDAIIGATWNGGVIRHRGRVVFIAGRNRVDYAFNAGQHHEVEILHAGHFTRDDLQQACRLVVERVIAIAPIIQNILPIAEAPVFYERLRDAPGSTFGTVFDWTDAA